MYAFCNLSSLYFNSFLQGIDQSPKPLIIGPEEDYDPGYFNNEVTVFQFTPLIFLPCFTHTAPDWKLFG